jgi:serine/threonine-protein kinase
VLLHEPVPPRRFNTRVPRVLKAICLRCLRKEPDKRYVSAEALAEDLRSFLLDSPVQARPIHLWRRVVKWVRRQPLAAVGLGTCRVAVLMARGYFLCGLE